MTGGRVKLIDSLIKDNSFFLTYGDGISDVNINKLLLSHKKSKKMVTVTAVKPQARFGEITLKGNIVKTFKEKQQTEIGWINGGFFVINKQFMSYIKNSNTVLEKEPLEKVCREMKLNAYKHNGFWQCIDTIRDLDFIEKHFKK